MLVANHDNIRPLFRESVNSKMEALQIALFIHTHTQSSSSFRSLYEAWKELHLRWSVDDSFQGLQTRNHRFQGSYVHGRDRGRIVYHTRDLSTRPCMRRRHQRVSTSPHSRTCTYGGNSDRSDRLGTATDTGNDREA